jgi:hypothetical protein
VEGMEVAGLEFAEIHFERTGGSRAIMAPAGGDASGATWLSAACQYEVTLFV